MSKFDWFSQPLFGNKARWKWLKVLSMNIDILMKHVIYSWMKTNFQLRREVQIKRLKKKKMQTLS
jgi:hypothetical protein